MIIANAHYVNDDFQLQKGDLYVVGEKVYTSTLSNEEDTVLDCSDCTVVPGFIDIHTHGGNGADVCDGDEKSFDTLSEYYASRGVTSFCPTTMTLPEAKLRKIFRAAAAYKGKETGAYMHGMNMEGPYISFEKKGAQNGKYIRNPSVTEFNRLNSIFRISIVDVAPETEGAKDFALYARGLCTVSAAHTSSDADTAREAFKNGFTHVTHLYNAMTGFKAREPGVIGAVLESKKVTAELICDGFHNNPVTVRATFRSLGEDRICVVSDSMSSAGCPDGTYRLGGQNVYVKGGKALLKDGTIAASVSNIHEEFLNLLDFGIPFSTALKACTINPAKVIGADLYTGSIRNGKFADLTVLDGNMDIKYVIVKGKVVFQK